MGTDFPRSLKTYSQLGFAEKISTDAFKLACENAFRHWVAYARIGFSICLFGGAVDVPIDGVSLPI